MDQTQQIQDMYRETKDKILDVFKKYVKNEIISMEFDIAGGEAEIVLKGKFRDFISLGFIDDECRKIGQVFYAMSATTVGKNTMLRAKITMYDEYDVFYSGI